MFDSKLKKSFLVPASTFDNVQGTFPIGFFVWDTAKREPFLEATTDCFSAKGEFLQAKQLVPVTREGVINKWLHGFFDPSGETIGWLCFVPNDFQHNNGVFFTSQPSDSLIRESRVAAITKRNVSVFAIYLAVRHCIASDWLNDRDQFLWPADSWKDDAEFQLDCLAFALFHGQNRISCKAGTNHWIPFAEDEVGAKDAFKSHFMSDFLKRVLSPLKRPSSKGVPHSLPPSERGVARSAGGSTPCEDEAAVPCVARNTPPPGFAGSPLSEGAEPCSAPSQSFLFPESAGLLLAAEAPATWDATGGASRPGEPRRLGGDASPHPFFSSEAQAVFDAGRELWRYYHAQPDALPDASFYDIRARFQGFKPNGHMNADSSDPTYTTLVSSLRMAERALAAKLAPKVREHGFLR